MQRSSQDGGRTADWSHLCWSGLLSSPHAQDGLSACQEPGSGRWKGAWKVGRGTQCLDSSSAPSPFNQGLIPNCSSALTNKETPTQVLERFVKFTENSSAALTELCGFLLASISWKTSDPGLPGAGSSCVIWQRKGLRLNHI